MRLFRIVNEKNVILKDQTKFQSEEKNHLLWNPPSSYVYIITHGLQHTRVQESKKKPKILVDTLICLSETSNESDWETIILLNLTPPPQKTKKLKKIFFKNNNKSYIEPSFIGGIDF